VSQLSREVNKKKKMKVITIVRMTMQKVVFGICFYRIITRL